jgi:hypothetical protein
MIRRTSDGFTFFLLHRLFLFKLHEIAAFEEMNRVSDKSGNMPNIRPITSPCFLLAGSFFSQIFVLALTNENIWRHRKK